MSYVRGNCCVAPAFVHLIDVYVRDIVMFPDEDFFLKFFLRIFDSKYYVKKIYFHFFKS